MTNLQPALMKKRVSEPPINSEEGDGERWKRMRMRKKGRRSMMMTVMKVG